MVFAMHSGFPPTKLDYHDISEIFVKVTLNTIIVNSQVYCLAVKHIAPSL